MLTNVNFKKEKPMKKFILILTIFTTLLNAVYIKLENENFTVKEDIRFLYSGMSGNKLDWLAIYPVNSSNDWENVISWKYTNGRNWENLQLPKIKAVGEYEVRAFFNNRFKLEGKSKPFKVIESITGELKIKIAHNHLITCSSIPAITFEHMGGNTNDWMALYPVGSTNDWSNVKVWRWLRNMENGTVRFPLNSKLTTGEYEVRAFFNNSFILEGTSNPLFITNCNNPIKIITSKREYFKDETVDINFSGLSTQPNNWIGIYKKGTKTLAENNIAWQWAKENNGQLKFSNLPIGEYDARVFLNNSYHIENLVSFNVTNLTSQSFPNSVLDGTPYLKNGVFVKYNKAKTRAYIFVKKGSLYSKKHKGVTAIDYTDKNNPIITGHFEIEYWDKDKIYFTEDENILTLLVNLNRGAPRLITLDVNNLDLLDYKNGVGGRDGNPKFYKADQLDLFFSVSRSVEKPSYQFFTVALDGTISNYFNIDNGFSDYRYIVDTGTISKERYFITYHKLSWINKQDVWRYHKKIYDVSNLPEMPLIDTIVTLTKP